MSVFVLIRHGVTDHIGNTITGRTPGVHLNEAGGAQAERVARMLQAAPIRAIYSSPLERTLDTAEPIARTLGLEVQVNEALLELDFGDWTGMSFQQVERSPEWARFNAFRSCTRAPEGESMVETQARAVAELARLRRRHPADWVAVVTHGDVIRALLLHFMGIPTDLYWRIEISPASVSIVKWDDEMAQVWRVNDTGELPRL